MKPFPKIRYAITKPTNSLWEWNANRKYNGGILAYVLAISVLVSVVLSMLILYVYYSRMEYQIYERRIRLLENLESAISITLGEYEYFDYDEEYVFDLFGAEHDSIAIMRTQWGVLDLFTIRAFDKQLEEARAYTIGHKPAQKGMSALYLVDNGRPVSMVGDAKLVGTCYLPAAGIQSAYINRIGYQNKELIEGEELRSEQDMPEVELEELFENLEDLDPEEAIVEQDTLVQSFLAETVQISGSSLRLSGHYQGNILINGSRRVVLDSTCTTVDVLVYAPVIELMSGFKGNGQFIATDSILVNKKVTLDYPSALIVHNDRDNGLIKLDTGATIQGWVMMSGDEHLFRQRVIRVEEESEVKGMIYCNGMLETYGKILGHTTTKRFLVNAPLAVYENYLFNTTLDATKRDTSMLALSEWFYTPDSHILKYLY